MKKIVLSLLAAGTALTMSATASAATFTNDWSFYDGMTGTIVKGTLSGLQDGTNISASGLSATVTQAPFAGFGTFNVSSGGQYSASNGLVNYASFVLGDGMSNHYLYFGTKPGNGTYYPELYVNGKDAYNMSTGTSFAAAAGAVPEPATWAMMLVGIGMMGFAMRRRNKNVTTTVAYAA